MLKELKKYISISGFCATVDNGDDAFGCFLSVSFLHFNTSMRNCFNENNKNSKCTRHSVFIREKDSQKLIENSPI